MCKCFKLELDLKAEFETEEFQKELEEMERKINLLLSSDPDTRYEMVNFNFYENKKEGETK